MRQKTAECCYYSCKSLNKLNIYIIYHPFSVVYSTQRMYSHNTFYTHTSSQHASVSTPPPYHIAWPFYFLLLFGRFNRSIMSLYLFKDFVQNRLSQQPPPVPLFGPSPFSSSWEDNRSMTSLHIFMDFVQKGDKT